MCFLFSISMFYWNAYVSNHHCTKVKMFQSNRGIIRRHQVCFPTWLRLVFWPSCPCFLCTVSLIYVDHHIWTSSDFVFFLCIISFLPNRCLICGRALILLVFESVFFILPLCLSPSLWAGCQNGFEDFCASNWRSFHFSPMLPSFMWASCERIENSTFIASTGFLGVSVFLSSFGDTCLFATQ